MKKRFWIIPAALLLAASLAGCSADSQASANQSNYIGIEAAKNAAVNKAQVALADAAFIKTDLSQKNGLSFYEIDFKADGYDYYYAIDAMTGAVIESKSTASVQGQQNDKVANNQIDETTAKQKALEHAGVKEDETTFLQVKQDYEDGVLVYEVEFFVATTNSEYDYEIDATTGEIRSFDYDAESYSPEQASTSPTDSSNSAKSEDEVRKIALAKVPGATASDIRLTLDRDDGRLLYEGKIVYDDMKYEFEIDAYSGAILEWEAESVFD